MKAVHIKATARRLRLLALLGIPVGIAVGESPRPATPAPAAPAMVLELSTPQIVAIGTMQGAASTAAPIAVIRPAGGGDNRASVIMPAGSFGDSSGGVVVAHGTTTRQGSVITLLPSKELSSGVIQNNPLAGAPPVMRIRPANPEATQEAVPHTQGVPSEVHPAAVEFSLDDETVTDRSTDEPAPRMQSLPADAAPPTLVRPKSRSHAAIEPSQTVAAPKVVEEREPIRIMTPPVQAADDLPVPPEYVEVSLSDESEPAPPTPVPAPRTPRPKTTVSLPPADTESKDRESNEMERGNAAPPATFRPAARVLSTEGAPRQKLVGPNAPKVPLSDTPATEPAPMPDPAPTLARPSKRVVDVPVPPPLPPEPAPIAQPIVPPPSVTHPNVAPPIAVSPVASSLLSPKPTAPTTTDTSGDEVVTSAVPVATRNPTVNEVARPRTGAVAFPEVHEKLQSVQTRVGENPIVALAGVVRAQVEKPELCDAVAANGNVYLIPRQAGSCRVAVWQEANSAGPNWIELTIQGAAPANQSNSVIDQLQQIMRQRYPRGNVQLQSTGQVLVVRGTVQSENEARDILGLVRGTCLCPVQDKLEVRAR